MPGFEIVRTSFKVQLAKNPSAFGGHLHRASAQGKHKVVKALLDQEPELIESEGREAIASAVGNDHDKVVKLLIKANPELLHSRHLFQAVEHGQWRMALVLIEEFARLCGLEILRELLTRHTGDEKLTILHRAVKSWHFSFFSAKALIAKLLNLKFQQQANSVDAQGNTVLHDAVDCDYLGSQVLEGVLEMSDPAAVYAVNKAMCTPFDLALVAGTGKAEVLQWRMSLDEILKRPHFARSRVPAHLDELVRRPLLALLHRDVVGIVCDYVHCAISD